MSALHKGESGAVYMAGNVFTESELQAQILAAVATPNRRRLTFRIPKWGTRDGECELCGEVGRVDDCKYQGATITLCEECQEAIGV